MGTLSKPLQSAVFYGILDAGYVARADMFKKCAQLIQSGSRIIQLRAKNLQREQIREIAMEVLPLFDVPNAPFFIINDDAELAASIPNAGLHIGQDDMSPKDARKLLGNDRVLGLSTHSVSQAKGAIELAEVLDYFAVGPVYATNTKPGRPAVGLELVSAVATMKPPIPWFAIGGINLDTASSVRKAGAERIVAVSDVLIPEDTVKAVAHLIDRFKS